MKHFKIVLALAAAMLLGLVQLSARGGQAPVARPQGPCDIYAAAKAPCVAAHSSTRALYAAYDGPLYQVLRQSDGRTLDIGVVRPASPTADEPGGYADAARQDAFCANTTCWISVLYDQSGRGNHLVQPPHGGFNGPALGGFNNLPIADMAPVTLMGHKVYGVFIAPGMGLRLNDTHGIAVDDQAEGQYWVINGHHYNSGCCFDYGNAEIDSRDDGNGTMETTYYGNAPWWFHGIPPGPWVMTDQENNLVGCVNPDGSKLCANLPSITWRFVTAVAKGEPHHWTSMGGDSQRGPMQVMFDGPRVDATYDPMRKQGAILLGNGGDNSNGSQGTYYEGAMTAPGTFPSDAVDQQVQANVVAARYDLPALELAPAGTVEASPGLLTLAPGASREVTLRLRNTQAAPVTDVSVQLNLPAGWTSQLAGSTKMPASPVAPGQVIDLTYRIRSGASAFNGDLTGSASWTTRAGAKQTTTAALKVRNVAAVKINEFRISDGTANTSNSFIELYNAGDAPIDLSGWTLTTHPTQQAVFGAVTLPAGTKLAPRGFHVLGLANSGLAAPAHRGDTVLHLRSTEGLKAGGTLTIGSGATQETRRIVSVGSAAGAHTTVWQPLPEGPVITVPAGSTVVPVDSTAGFRVGEKIALGHGATYPAVGRDVEQYEIATITAVGTPGAQAFLGADAPAGSTNIKVTNVDSVSVGDQIRLDIDSIGHGIETVTVARVGTRAYRTTLTAPAEAGATVIKVRGGVGFGGSARIPFAPGTLINIGMPNNRQPVTVSAVTWEGMTASLTITPALAVGHIRDEDAVVPGTGLDLAAPLRFAHADNLPLSIRGSGIRFTPATRFARGSNEPVLPLGTGVTLDQPLAGDHPIHTAVRDSSVTTAGYQSGTPPQQWFGGPALSTSGGAMVLRDAAGHVVDSLNYGGVVDPWIAEGYQAVSGMRKSGCHVAVPGAVSGGGPGPAIVTTHSSAFRFPDGHDTDSNCGDFRLAPATTLALKSEAGASNLKVASVAGFEPGQKVQIGGETVTVSQIGTAGAGVSAAALEAGATSIPMAIASARSFATGQEIVIDDGTRRETAKVLASGFGGEGGRVSLEAPLRLAHAAGVTVAGTGITLAAALKGTYESGTQVGSARPTPGAANAAP